MITRQRRFEFQRSEIRVALPSAEFTNSVVGAIKPKLLQLPEAPR